MNFHLECHLDLHQVAIAIKILNERRSGQNYLCELHYNIPIQKYLFVKHYAPGGNKVQKKLFAA